MDLSFLTARSLRFKILFSFVSTVFTLSLWAFRELEGLGWLDSIYFLIVTVSTVGFGDVTPTHPLTKFILILLIITGISTIALTSETVIDKLIQARLENRYYLPIKPLDVSNHVIIVGYSNLVHNLAKYIEDRFIRVIIIYEDSEKVIEARNAGLEAYTGHSESPEVLDILRIENAIGLYLFHEKDNLAIQTAIFSKQINPSIKIYAKTLTHLSIEYGQLVGIDRTYHRERLVASFISNTSRNFRTLLLPNQDVSDSEFRIYLTYDSKEFRKRYPRSYPLGYVDRNFSDLISLHTKLSEIPDDAAIHMIATHKDEVIEGFANIGDPIPLKFERVFLTGYNEHIKHITEHLTFDKAAYWYLTFNEENYKEALENGENVIYCPKENLLEELPKQLRSTDLVVVMFSEITVSLVLSAILMKLEDRPRVLQLVEQSYEVDIFKKIGVDRVISPDVLIARGMFQILLTESQMTQSMVYRNSQMFEYKVREGDRFEGKSIKEIEKLGYQVLLHRKVSDGSITPNPVDIKIKDSDNVIFYKAYEVLNKISKK